MKVLIDTNIVLDVLFRREPHYEQSFTFLQLCGQSVSGCVLASQTTDIFYFLRRDGLSVRAAKASMQELADNLKVLDIKSADVQSALACDMPDYEDALLAYCGKRHRMAYIVTRNERDFGQSPVPALSPAAFLEQFFAA